MQRAPYEVPERLAQSGRPRALSAMIVVLGFCSYLAWLGGPGPYIGGLIAILDLLIMLCLFFGLRPDQLSETGRPRKRRLAGHRRLTPALALAAPAVPEAALAARLVPTATPMMRVIDPLSAHRRTHRLPIVVLLVDD